MSVASIVAPKVGIPIEAGVAVTKAAVGEENYERGRSAAVRAAAIWNGFGLFPAPFIPLFPIKIVLFIIILLICIFALGIGWWSVPVAYLGQGLIIMYFSEKILSLVLRFGFGI